MRCDQVKNILSVALSEEIDCQEEGGHVVVSSPFMNLDGDYPEVHIVEDALGNLLLTDYGESYRSLADKNIDLPNSQVRAEVLDRVYSLLGVRLERGRFQITVPADDLGNGILRMFQTFAFVEDLIFTASPREEAEFKDRVISILMPLATHGRLQRNQEFIGKSGRKYSADFHLHRSTGLDVWIEAITATTPSSFRNQVDHAHAMWSDALDASVRRITLLDDTDSVMESGDANLLANVCVVEFWSDQNRFQERIVQMTTPHLR